MTGKPRGRNGGRKPGIPNQSTINARHAIAALVDNNLPLMQAWLTEIAETKGPEAAWKCMTDVIEYHIPKLARTEITGSDGGPLVLKISPEDAKL
jgi:hypothetical protein